MEIIILIYIIMSYSRTMSRNSAMGIVTGYGLDN
jgi:hypothetical protein